MSVERVVRVNGTVVWRVRWREGARNRSRVLGRKRDADAFDGEVRRRKRTGGLLFVTGGKQTLSSFGAEWWELHANPNLAPATLELYAMLWHTHILPRLGAVPLWDLTPETIRRFRVDLERAGTGRASVRKALVLLHGVLQRAVEWGRIESNPARHVPKPPAARSRGIRPLSPEAVERIRAALLARDLVGDAALVSVLAYAGLRPGEALALTWAHIRRHTILVDVALSLGRVAETKTRKRRTVRLLDPLSQDLAAWRLYGAPASPDEAWVFPDPSGSPWTRTRYQNWRRRIYVPAAVLSGISNTRPYDLRHSFVSLLIAEGHNVVEVAQQAGHSPTLALETYSHLFEEYEMADRTSAVERIWRARTNVQVAATQPRLFEI